MGRQLWEVVGWECVCGLRAAGVWVWGVGTATCGLGDSARSSNARPMGEAKAASWRSEAPTPAPLVAPLPPPMAEALPLARATQAMRRAAVSATKSSAECCATAREVGPPRPLAPGTAESDAASTAEAPGAKCT